MVAVAVTLEFECTKFELYETTGTLVRGSPSVHLGLPNARVRMIRVSILADGFR